MQRSFQQHNHPSRNLNHFPEYAQKYPSFARYHLCDVKRGISYPNQPTFRNIDRDNVLHKLSDEHCRHTTLCGPGMLFSSILLMIVQVFQNILSTIVAKQRYLMPIMNYE